MCRSAIREEAQAALGAILAEMAAVLAAQWECDPDEVRCGPVDFGGEDEA